MILNPPDDEIIESLVPEAQELLDLLGAEGLNIVTVWLTLDRAFKRYDEEIEQ